LSLGESGQTRREVGSLKNEKVSRKFKFGQKKLKIMFGIRILRRDQEKPRGKKKVAVIKRHEKGERRLSL